MKTIAAVFVLSLAALMPSAVSAADPHKFLADTYGWTIDQKLLKEVKCPDGRDLLPGAKSRGWVCQKQDTEFWTVVYWSKPDLEPKFIREMTFVGMAGGKKDYGQIKCDTEQVKGEMGGVIEDCQVPLNNGTFFVSFYHFKKTVQVPVGFGTETKPLELVFTLWVQNAGVVNRDVGKQLRSLVLGIQAVSAPVSVPVSTVAQDEIKK